VVIAVGGVSRFICWIPSHPRLTPVFRNCSLNSKGIYFVLIFWMHTDLPKHPTVRTREWTKEIMDLTHLLPGFAFIVTAINNPPDYYLLNSPFVGIHFSWPGVTLLFMIINKCINNIWIRM